MMAVYDVYVCMCDREEVVVRSVRRSYPEAVYVLWDVYEPLNSFEHLVCLINCPTLPQNVPCLVPHTLGGSEVQSLELFSSHPARAPVQCRGGFRHTKSRLTPGDIEEIAMLQRLSWWD